MALLLAACDLGAWPKDASSWRETEIPGGRMLVRDGLTPDGDLVVTLDQAGPSCGAPQAWRSRESGGKPVARGRAQLDGRCPPVTARLAPNGRTLAVHDFSAGRAFIYERAPTRITDEGDAVLTTAAGYGFPPPGPNLSFSDDGGRLLLGAPHHGCRASPFGFACGAAELFSRESGGWRSRLIIRPSSEAAQTTRFGQAVALSPDGDAALVGGTGQPGHAGGLWLFSLAGGTARELGALRPDRVDSWFANDVALAGDGSWLAVGGEQAVYLYQREGEGFALRRRLSAPEPAAGHFGEAVALAADGRSLVVGAPRSPCAAGDRCGAAYLYGLDREWTLTRVVRPAVNRADANFGHRLGVSQHSRRIAVQGAALHVFELP